MSLKINKSIILFFIVLNLLLTRFFDNILLAGIPINQIFLIFLIFSIKFFDVMKLLTINLNLKVYYYFLLYGIIMIIYDGINKGIWAYRDGLYIINSLFLPIGFYYSKKIFNYQVLDKFFKSLIFFSILYVFFKIFALDKLSPVIYSIQGNEFKLINYFGSNILWIWCFFIIVINYQHRNIYILLSLIFIIASIIFAQQRTLYLAIIFIFIFLYFFYKSKEIKFFKYFYIFFFIIFFYNLFDISIEGRLENFSLEFLFNHFKTLFFFLGNDDGNLTSQVGTAKIRLFWWKQIILEIISDPFLLFFGKGFGEPLIDFSTSAGVYAREPHNMFITIFARQGLIGIFIFLLFMYKLIKIFFDLIKENNNDILVYKHLIIFFVYFLIVFTFFLSDSTLTYSFYSIPFYFFWGVVIGRSNSENKS